LNGWGILTEKLMKTSLSVLLFIVVLLNFGCKDDNDKLLDSVSGTWQISKINYKSDTKPDSVITCQNCVLQLDNCKLGNGGCDGYYKLMDGLKVNLNYSTYGKAQEVSLSIVKEPSNPLNKLIGVYEVKNLTDNSMTLLGKIFYRVSANRSIEYDTELSLKR
jgi:uncharacterized lipoprotein YehR (DUF1307 family)